MAEQATPRVRDPDTRPCRFVPGPAPLTPPDAHHAVRVQVHERPPSQNGRAAHEAKLADVARRLTAPEQLTAAVPAPLARQIVYAERVSLLEAYNRELRNPTWAPAMEAAIQAFFAAVVLPHAPGVVIDLECRTSSCRVSFGNVPTIAHSREAPSASGFDEVMDRVHGFLGVPQRNILSNDGRQSLIFLLDGDGMFPQRYAAWQKHGAELTQANIAALRAGLPPVWDPRRAGRSRDQT